MFRIASKPVDGWETVKQPLNDLEFLLAANTIKEDRELFNKRPFSVCALMFHLEWVRFSQIEYVLMKHLTEFGVSDRTVFLYSLDGKIGGLLCESSTLSALARSLEHLRKGSTHLGAHINIHDIVRFGNLFNVRFHEIT